MAEIPPGALISTMHPLLPGGAATGALVTEISRDYLSGAMSITIDYPPAPAPAVQIAGYSGRFRQAAATGTQVVIGDGSISVVIADDSGKILPGAIVTIDGERTAIADIGGRVTFSGLRSGKHSLEVRATGYAPYLLEVAV
jgi:hypothetical protein